MLERSLMIAGCALAMFSSSALAADLIIPETPEPIMEASGFSWDGMYIGARIGAMSFGGGPLGDVGGVIGVNFLASDNILLGLELTGDIASDGGFTNAEAFLMGRAGILASDTVLLYGIGGLGVFADNTPANGVIYGLGGGLEVAVTDDLSIRGELTGAGLVGGPIAAFKGTVGVNFHF